VSSKMTLTNMGTVCSHMARTAETLGGRQTFLHIISS